MAAPKKTSQASPESKKQDENIMGTNNSSIVSKRSVERIYFSHEPHFFRYFVKKLQRRSPLINRGYWLRMKAIDSVTRGFLEAKSGKRKIVINVGCGFDPLPWQCLTRYPDACNEVIFIDIDYRELILRKRAIVQEEPKLSSILSNVVTSDGHVLLHSNQYIQVGCDLHKLTQLNDILSGIIKFENCMILLTAEVSITYMDVNAADDFLKWASNLPNAHFCLLEQILPAGEEHPFGHTMMAHFKKLRTPLGAVKKYPTTKDQQQRFENLGWIDISVQNLWKLWNSDFLSASERSALDAVEPFDEWEEFALFANHYFLLTARTDKSSRIFNSTKPINIPTKEIACVPAYSSYQKSQGNRRFAAALFVRSQARDKDRIALFGGMGKMARLKSRDEYTCFEQDDACSTNSNSTLAPSSRMCHSITDLGDAGALLVGGRTSPDVGLSDCWIYHKWLDIWERVDSLPWPLYRHQALKVGSCSVLVSTGRINSSTLSNSFILWSRKTGWVVCSISGIVPNSGILAGGISTEGVINEEILEWELTGIISGNPTLDFRKNLKLSSEQSEISKKLLRFGACTIRHLGAVYILGGIAKDDLLLREEEMFCLQTSKDGLNIALVVESSASHPWPLLIGASAISTGRSIVILGGSAVCFSFGNFWNQVCLTLAPFSSRSYEDWRFLHTIESKIKISNFDTSTSEDMKMLDVLRIKLRSTSHFEEVRNAGKPVIFEELDIGPCTEKWNLKYLTTAIGEKREVIIHEATTEHMDFTAKNFRYRTVDFGDFSKQIEHGAKLYLRSLSDQPFERPVNLHTDFNSISPDFSLPSELSFVTENTHSSPLRISGPVIMWLHYDTLANVLCQIQGSKKMILFHPLDFKYFGFEPGSSCSSTNIFASIQDQQLSNAQPYQALLKPGDVIYIPPLWLHTATPLSDHSIAVNVFFKNLSTGYASGKDVYGNRDLQAYEKGRLDVAKISASFDKFPSEIRAFYLQRLAEELALTAKI